MKPLQATASFEWHGRSSYGALLRKRQAGGQSGTLAVPSTSTLASPSSNPTSNNNPNTSGGFNGGQGQAPLTVYTFIIAIALFVLVVSFVLLRIFVRNRRLRALGLYPESPIERLLGGAPREYEDTLPPPKLWDAKIADVRANNSGAIARAEKSMLGGGVGAGDVKEHGWDALMPVSAALPPNLYPVIFQQDNTNATNPSTGANATNANADATAATASGVNPAFSPSRLTRHMPHFLRPRSASGADAAAMGTAAATSNADPSAPSGKANAQADSAAAGAKAVGEEKLASSVNVTVLIAMPSPNTVFPSTRRNLHTRSTSRLNGSGILAVASGNSKLEEVNETGDADSSSDKGKARRAPSLHSIRTTASAKSQGEARRDAFFGAQTEDAPLPPVDPRPYDDEEDELPELVFGTASVPLYSKIAIDESTDRSTSSSRKAMSLTPPTRDELLALMAAATEARTQKPKPRQKDKSKSEDDGDAATTVLGAAARQSVAGTSMEGNRGAEDHTASGDVLLHNNRGIVEEYEMGALTRPSMGGIGNNSASFVGDDTRNTEGARLSMSNSVLLSSGAPMGVNDEAASTTDSPQRRAAARGTSVTSAVGHSSSSALSGGMSAHTARENSSSPTNTQTDRQSFTTWHTGDENDDVAHLAAHAINFDPPTTPASATSHNANGGARV